MNSKDRECLNIAMYTKLPYAALGQGPGQRSLEGVLLNIVVVLLEEQRVHKELLILSLSTAYFVIVTLSCRFICVSL